MDARQILLDNGYEDVVIFENPDYSSALIGVSEDNRAVYSFDLMVESLVDEEEMSIEDAMEVIYHDTIGNLGNIENAPIVMCPLFRTKEE